jgi:putative hemolysin
MTLLEAAVALVLLTALSALCSGLETGLYGFDRVRIRLRAEEGDRRARRLLAAAARPAATVVSLLVANNIFNFFASTASSRLLELAAPGEGGLGRGLLDAALLTPFLFVFGELAPKTAFLRAPTRRMRRFEPALTLIRGVGAVIVAPVLALVERIGGAKDDDGGSHFDRAAIGRLLTEEAEIAGLSPAQRRLAERVLRLRQAVVEERMTPLAQVVEAPASATAAEVVRLGAAAEKSRLPVRAPGAPSYLGSVSVTDAAIAAEESDAAGYAAAHVHELPMIPARGEVASALARFQRRRKPLMQVVDRKGRAVGLLAASDLVNALFEP